MRHELGRLDPTQAIASAATIGQLAERDTARQRFNMSLLLTFGIGSLLLAVAGAYSVVAENLSERKREIAITLALGAARPRLVSHLVSSTVALVLVGEVFGMALVVLAGKAMTDLLYEVTPSDPLVLGSVLAFVLFVSGVSASVPAWIATGHEPRVALQAD